MLLLDETKKQEIFTQLNVDPENNFKILKPLGEGAYGAVFKAQDTRDKMLVALKVMRFDPDECQDLLSEIKILRQCNHENIVNFKDTFYKDGNIWLAMEFCEGGSALDIIKVSKHTLSERQCQCVLYHSLRGLQYLHSKNLIHRDIKAANILINKDGKCKLADFGVARAMRASGAGTTIGSPYWMAPEVLGTEKYDNSADIWSLGIAAIEMVIGKPPLSNYKPLQAMFMIPKNDPPSIPEEYIDDFSQGFIDFLAKCLTKNAAARPTAEQLLQDPYIVKVAQSETVETELIPWITKMLPLIEKDRDLKARLANESFDESKWSDYTASLKRRLSREGSTVFNGTMLRNDDNGSTLKVVQDGATVDAEDDYMGGSIIQHSINEEDEDGTIKYNEEPSRQSLFEDTYTENDNGGTLVRKDTADSIKMDRDSLQISVDEMNTLKINSSKQREVDSDEDEFDGGTMITIQTKEDEEAAAKHDQLDDNNDDDDDEYHENGFSPSSGDTVLQQQPFNQLNAIEKTSSAVTNISTTSNGTKESNNKKVAAGQVNATTPAISAEDPQQPSSPLPIQNPQLNIDAVSNAMTETRSPRNGGGYSIGNRDSLDGNTMVRQNSTDDEEEDPFQGQTMYRAPTVDSPRVNIISDDDEEEDVDAEDEDGSVIISPSDEPQPSALLTESDRVDRIENSGKDKDANMAAMSYMNHNPRVDILGSPAMSMQANTGASALSDTEDTYELRGGYANKPQIASNNKMTASTLKETNPMSPVSETPQPTSANAIQHDILAPHSDQETAELIVAGSHNKKRESVKGAGSRKHSKRASKKLQTDRSSLRDEDLPTSPIPQYKHIEVLVDGDQAEIVGKNKTNADEEDDYDDDDKGAMRSYNEMIDQLAILANQLDFTKLVGKISCMEHALMILSVLATWIFIVSYITLESSEKKRPREMQLFLVSSGLAILVFLLLNPFYFAKFADKYVPSSSQQLFQKTQPVPSSNTNANIPLRLNAIANDSSNQLKYHNKGDEDSEDGLENINNYNHTKLYHQHQSKIKQILYQCFIWFARLVALSWSLCLSYYIYIDLSQGIYSEFTRYCMVILMLTLFVGNLPLMGHFLLYFGNVFVLYYVLGWIVVFGAEFVYFHLVRHLSERLIATDVLLNIIMFVFHLLITKWASYVLKHATLWQIDPNLFPNSNHYRVYFNFDNSYYDRTNQHSRHASNHGNIVIKNGAKNGMGNNGGNENNDDQLLISNYIQPYRTVSCCCGKLVCDSHTLLRFQSYASALSFWSFLGVMYTVGFEYVVFSSCVFMLVNTIWNPLFYSKEVISIRDNAKCCCSCKKWVFVFMLVLSYCVGFVLNISWFAFSISAFILKDSQQIPHATLINIVIFLFAAIVFFLPAVGYSFYRIPVTYGLANIFGALFCFFIPLRISFKPHSIISGVDQQLLDDWFFIYDDKKNVIYLGIVVCAVVFALYLTFTGLSCVGYRIRKALYERAKSFSSKEFPMNMIMFWSFLLSFSVLTTNSLWVFGDNFGSSSYDPIRILAQLVYIVTICVQCSSLMYALFTLKRRFDENPKLTAYLSALTDNIRKSCGFCCFLLLFPIIYISYLIFIILLSFVLGITKLLTIRQVREFWLSFLIANFDATKESTDATQARPSENNQMINSVPTQSYTKANTSSRNERIPVEIEVVAMNHQISLGEHNHLNTFSMNEANANNRQPRSPNTDFLDNDEPRKVIHRRMSSSAIQSVHMKVFKCCDCCTPRWMSMLYINEGIYNNYLMSELIVESLPLLMLNLVNMLLLSDRITTVSLVQAACSAVFLLYSCAKTIYYVRFHEWNLAKFLM